MPVWEQLLPIRKPTLPATGEEVWKEIPGLLGYEASDMGRVRRTIPGQGTHPGRVLVGKTINLDRDKITSPCIAPRQIYGIRGGRATVQVTRARLVCLAFKGTPQFRHLQQVRHLDGDVNNCLSQNLDWRDRWGQW